jgi:(2Fe-2S) ferredoxin
MKDWAGAKTQVQEVKQAFTRTHGDVVNAAWILRVEPDQLRRFVRKHPSLKRLVRQRAARKLPVTRRKKPKAARRSIVLRHNGFLTSFGDFLKWIEAGERRKK